MPHVYATLDDANEAIRRVMDSIQGNLFSAEQHGLFQPLCDSALERRDHYCHLADLEAYITAQERASADFTKRSEWARRAALNVARIGKFSSDRTINEYARDIWHIKPVLE